MLTVDYDRLGVAAGELVLDMGCGAGRHAFEAFRRGARVVALDADYDELIEVPRFYAAMVAEGEAPVRGLGAAVNGDAMRLPFPDHTFDRVIASEVLEHLVDDETALAELTRVLRPGGSIAVTVPAWLAETVCWKLSDEYYAPKSVGGHVRIYTEAELREKLRAAGVRPGAAHHAHGLHTPYWWLRCAVGPTNDDHPLVRAYHRLLVWDITDRPLVTRLAERVLSPVLGKSIVVYSHKPGPAKVTGSAVPTPATEPAHVAA